jgi:ABC-type amino acid transport substrate-binding protein
MNCYYNLVFSISLFFVFAISAPVLAADGQELNHRVDFALYEYPPLYHTSVEGNFSGTVGETIKEMCREGGLDCITEMYPIARAYDLTTLEIADMTISGKHPRFEECCVATEWTYPWSAGFFSALPGIEIPMTESEMVGKSVIIVRGWRSPYRFMPNFDQLVAEKKITVYYPDSNISAIQMLDSGRADLLWGSIDFFWYIEKLNLTGKFDYTERLKIPLVLWVNKTETQIINGLNKGFGVLKEKRVLDEQNLLVPEIMKKVFQDAPLKKSQ